ncbi:MAG: transposase [Candidatus Brocadiaceae bacterium]|nr:transposase [Candidatus Brocadiaceae bacterium]
MPRTARVVVPNYIHHITQRGNYRQNIFQDDEDRLRYLSWINEYGKKYNLSLFAYCLMDNMYILLQSLEKRRLLLRGRPKKQKHK